MRRGNARSIEVTQRCSAAGSCKGKAPIGFALEKQIHEKFGEGKARRRDVKAKHRVAEFYEGNAESCDV